MGTGLCWDVDRHVVYEEWQTHLIKIMSGLNAKEKEMGSSGCEQLSSSMDFHSFFYIHQTKENIFFFQYSITPQLDK